jgi:hypothetical protein
MLTKQLSFNMLLQSSAYQQWTVQCKDLVKNTECWLHGNTEPYLIKDTSQI